MIRSGGPRTSGGFCRFRRRCIGNVSKPVHRYRMRIGGIERHFAGFDMGWKPTGEPTVRKQRDKWMVRVEGIDTETGRVRPRQIGTFPSQRAARAAASKATASGDLPLARGTLAWLLDRWVPSG